MFPTDSVPSPEALESSLRRLCAELDPDAVPLPEATPMWTRFERIEKLAAGAKCRLARRVEESNAWRNEGDRSAVDWMARKAGTTSGRARAGLERSRRLGALPSTDRAVADGTLSDAQADAVADASTADPEAEQRLLRTAQRASMRDLRGKCARAKARVEDETARQDRLHRQRGLRTFKGTDGSWNLQVRNTREVGAEIEAALAPITDRIFHEARLEGRHEPREAYAADALTDLARAELVDEDEADAVPPEEVTEPAADSGPDGPPPSSCPSTSEGRHAPPNRAGRRRFRRRSRRPDTKVIALIDYEALKRGVAEGDETAEIAGVGPVPVGTIRSMLGDAFGAAIVTNGVGVYNNAHLGRATPAHQRTPLEARGYVCEVPGCGCRVALEIDHVDDWALTLQTRLDHLAWLCRRHHLAKTHRGYRLLVPPGNRRWLPPARPDPPADADADADAEPSAATLW